jgi:hypothetical protein
MAEPDWMFLAKVDRIPPDEEYADEEDSLCSRPGTFFHGSVPHPKISAPGNFRVGRCSLNNFPRMVTSHNG